MLRECNMWDPFLQYRDKSVNQFTYFFAAFSQKLINTKGYTCPT